MPPSVLAGVHLHTGNVILEQLPGPGGAAVCRLAEAELVLLGARPYAELLALPRPAPGSQSQQANTASHDEAQAPSDADQI